MNTLTDKTNSLNGLGGGATCLTFCPRPVISMPATSPETAVVARGRQAEKDTERRGERAGFELSSGGGSHVDALIFCVHKAHFITINTQAFMKQQVRLSQQSFFDPLGRSSVLQGLAVTWVRCFVNNFLRVPLAWLGSREAAE